MDQAQPNREWAFPVPGYPTPTSLLHSLPHAPTGPLQALFSLSSNLPLLRSPHSADVLAFYFAKPEANEKKLSTCSYHHTCSDACMLCLPSCYYGRTTCVLIYLWIRFHSFWPPQGHSSGSFLPLYWTIPSYTNRC